jgi:hypothetical protein
MMAAARAGGLVADTQAAVVLEGKEQTAERIEVGSWALGLRAGVLAAAVALRASWLKAAPAAAMAMTAAAAVPAGWGE